MVELVWGLKSRNPEDGPGINVRSEGRAFPPTIAALSPPPSSSLAIALTTERDGGSLWPMATTSTLPASGAQLRTAWPEAYAVLTTAADRHARERPADGRYPTRRPNGLA